MAIPVIEQVFLNSAIADFQASVGWNGNSTTLTTTLVDDPINNRFFTAPLPGSPCYFNFAGWIFGGLLRDYVKISEAGGGGITYKVTLTGLEELLLDTQINLDGYAGVSPLNNFFNIYGYLESTQGFGASQVNDAGMEYNLILSTLTYLANNTQDPVALQFGSPITFVNNVYGLDLSLMPVSLTSYRIAGPTISILDFISQVCEENSLDWFARLLLRNNQNIIQIVTANRSRAYNIGAITNFIQGTPGAHSKGIGLELRNETTAKFLVGDNIQALNTFNGTFPSGYLNTLGSLQGVSSRGDNQLAPFSITIGNYQNYPKDFAFNYKYSSALNTQLVANAFPVCFPHLESIYDVQQNTVWPFWGTDVLGYQYIPSHAQESKPFIDYMQLCFNDFDKIRSNNDTIPNGGKFNILAGMIQNPGINNGGAALVCGKSILSTLTWYHDNVFFFSPIAIYPYFISIGELRASLVSQDAWESYIACRSDMINNVDKWTIGFPDVNHKEIYSDYGTPVSNGAKPIGNPPIPGLFTRSDLLGINNMYALKDLQRLLPGIQNGDPALDPKLVQASANAAMNNAQDRYSALRLRKEQLYNAVHQLANEYYGRKFIISVQNVFVKLNDQLQPIYTDDPQREGFFQGPSVLGLNFLEQQFFTNQEGKIEAFVEFDSVNFIDITRLNPDDFIIKDVVTGTTYTNRNDIFTNWTTSSFTGFARLYLRCNIEPNLVFGNYVLSLQSLGATQNSLNYSDARVIVTLPSPVYFRNDASIFNCRTAVQQTGQFIGRMTRITPNAGPILYDLSANALGNVLNDPSNATVKNGILNSAAGKVFNQENAGMVLIPRDGAFGMKSNTSFYGPWFAQGAPGKVEFEQDPNINPWNFNGYANMNLAGQIKVNGLASTMQFSETGSVEFPDVPSVLLGDVLIAGGPNVTDVSVTVGPQGVMTNYSMRNFSPAYGGMSKLLYQKLRDSSKKTVVDQRNEKVIARIFENRLLQTPAGGDIRKLDVRAGSPHPMVLGGVIFKGGQISGTTVASETLAESIPDFSGNYSNIGAMSMEGLFRPYSTNSTNTNLQQFGAQIGYIQSGSQILPNNLVSALNPFPSGHDITYVVRGDNLPSDLNVSLGGYDSGNQYRGVGLKLPLIGIGFGLDISGNYVPGNASGYDSDYASNPSKWKVGPIDLRWDPNNKIWTTLTSGVSTTTGTNIVYAKTLQSMDVGQPGSGQLLSNHQTITLINQLSYPLCQGQEVMVFPESTPGIYDVINAQANILTVVTNVTCQADGTLIVTKRNIYLPAAYSNAFSTVLG